MGVGRAFRITGREVKFLDPGKTIYCESKKPVLSRQSGTKVGGAKTIRYRRSPNRKRYQPRVEIEIYLPFSELFRETIEFLGSGGSMVARLKLKEIDGRAPQGVEFAAQFDSTRENLPGPDTSRIDRLIALS